jgi:hypothetical protein
LFPGFHQNKHHLYVTIAFRWQQLGALVAVQSLPASPKSSLSAARFNAAPRSNAAAALSGKVAVASTVVYASSQCLYRSGFRAEEKFASSFNVIGPRSSRVLPNPSFERTR